MHGDDARRRLLGVHWVCHGSGYLHTVCAISLNGLRLCRDEQIKDRHRRIQAPNRIVFWCPITNLPAMSRLTITLSDERYRALKEAAAQRGRTIGQLIDESLEFYGIKSRDEAKEIVHRARANAGLTEDEAMSVALEEVERVRTGQ